MAGVGDDETTVGIFRGELSDLPAVDTKVIRIFLSSTFTGKRMQCYCQCLTFFNYDLWTKSLDVKQISNAKETWLWSMLSLIFETTVGAVALISR